ncbi:MAG: four helix bundle protein [Peptococcaceae bacterium]|nr:four helix bundle protein [Peptococcaceae bacterium]
MPQGSFTDLKVWQLAKDLAIETYKILNIFPADEQYALTAQIKRAVVSVAANIAEGFGRYHFRDKCKFFITARGSLTELRSHLLIAHELSFLTDESLDNLEKRIRDLSVRLNKLLTSTREMGE